MEVSESGMKQIKLLWIAVAAIFLMNVGTIVFVLRNDASGDSHSEDSPKADVPLAELLKAGPLEEMSIGDTKAPNVVVEYASMTCPHCASFHEKLFPELKSKYIDAGKIRFIFREFPLDKITAATSMVARCSGKDGYFAMIEMLFQTQEAWAFVEEPWRNWPRRRSRLDSPKRASTSVWLTKNCSMASPRFGSGLTTNLAWIRLRTFS